MTRFYPLLPAACGAALLLWFGLVFAQPPADPQAPTDPATPETPSTEDPTEPAEEGEEELPKLVDMPLPTAAELLRNPHADWIILKSGEVIVCEPVYPRPATLEKMQAKIDAYPSFKGVRTPEAVAAYRAAFDDLHHLNVVLPGDDDEPEYELDMKYIAEIRHHEDLMLRRIDVLIDEGKYRDAFEMLFVLERSHSDWPGYAERRERLLFLEAEQKFTEGKAEIALVTLEELYATNDRYRGLKNQLGAVTERLIVDAIEQDDYRRSRHFLLRLKSREPGHSVVSKWTDTLMSQAQAALQQAEQALTTGEYSQAVTAAVRAARIWPNMPGQPKTPNLIPVFDRANSRYPRLRVGVVQLPRERGTGDARLLEEAGHLENAADQRCRYLTRSTLFEVDNSDDSPHYRSRFFEQWEPTDLGRRVRFRLRQNRAGWESQPVVTAPVIMSSFAARLDPFGTLYDERLAGFVSSVAVISPFEFELQFSRVPPRIESLIRFPVTRKQYQLNQENGSRLEPTLELASPRFDLVATADNEVVYRRRIDEPGESNQFHVAEVFEQQYPNYEKAVQGLMRGEVSMLPRVHSRDVPALEQDRRFQVVETALPVTHLVQFNPHSPVVLNRELRRALVFAINREKILVETVLEDPAMERGRLVSGPFATRGLSGNKRGVRGYAYNRQVQPRPYDPALAASLRLAAGKQFDGEIPELKLLCVADPVALDAAKQLVQHWAAVGIRVKLITAADGPMRKETSDWDLIYRIVRLTEPTVQLWPLLTLEATARVESLRFLPDWLRQELIELDRAGDWKSAVGKLQDLHSHLAAEALLIPLWEVDDFLVFRQTIRGFPAVPMHAYQHIERWTVKPWLPNERPGLGEGSE